MNQSPIAIRYAVKVIWVMLLLQFFAVAAAGAPLASKVTRPAAEPTVITFVYFPMAVPVAVLGETLKRDRLLKRELERAGCSIAFRTLAKGADAVPLVHSRQVDAVMFSDMPAIEAASSSDLVIAGTVKRSYSSVLARSNVVLEQLAGKKVGNVPGSTSHYALLQALASVRLSEREVNLVPMELQKLPEALAQGRIDAFAAWEPTPTMTMKKYPGQFCVIYRQVSLSFFALSGGLLQVNRPAADALLAALIRAVRWLKKGSNLNTASRWAVQGMTAFSGRNAEVTAADIAAITRSDLLDVPAAPLISAADRDPNSNLLREFDFLKSIGRIPANASRERVRSSIRPDLLESVLGRRSRFRLTTFDYAP
ncbi:ABC transporter substrate-binding protein [Geomonas oryzae]|uniref:ABC transporter substrate-binding protein n=1 Tax=Geomonas oryzae TaxID=2364273 RepID=UPI00100B18F1|nr:ABC transporter substrate-binding protein [Geomonas oryzae]